jgi:hypothetical protein
MWTTENRPRYDPDKLRYPSDLTDPEWEQIKPLIPPAVVAMHFFLRRQPAPDGPGAVGFREAGE